MKVATLLRLLLGLSNIRVPNSIKLEFIVKFDPSCLLSLHDDADILKIFKFNDMFYCVYVCQCTEVGDGVIAPTSAPTPIVASNSAHVSSIGEPPLHMSNDSPTIESFGFSQRCAETNDSNVVQVHTFRNVHNHCLEDVALSQPLVRSTCAFLVIDDVIWSTLEYQPRQICKDFMRQHGIQLTYLQAWQMKEKAKERIYGLPKNYYKLLSWICERMVATNPESIVELSYSNDGHFEQLFVAHSISIQGFLMGC
ncbi:hypothetical protein AAG906_005838 [Vitis piasezkii]